MYNILVFVRICQGAVRGEELPGAWVLCLSTFQRVKTYLYWILTASVMRILGYFCLFA